MLIIFDLDDTLVDTSGCITPLRLERALRQMLQAGLRVPDSHQALHQLQQINQTAISSKEALQAFLNLYGCPIHEGSEILKIGLQVIYEDDEIDMPLNSLEGAQMVLNELSAAHEIALVTQGREVQQMAKLKKASIDSSLFSKIIVSEDRNKKGHYQAIQAELRYLAEQVLVCGDRILIDLVPAAELGFRTVHMRWGRGLYSHGSADHVIDSLHQIKAIVNQMEIRPR